MKSFASEEMCSNASSSKYQFTVTTLLRVSVSSSPRNGERPLRLLLEKGMAQKQTNKKPGWLMSYFRQSARAFTRQDYYLQLGDLEFLFLR